MSFALFRDLFTESIGGRTVLHAMPLMLGVLCVLAIAYRYYSAFLAAKVAVLDDRRRDAGPPLQRRPELSPDQQVGALRPSLRGHLRGRAADRPGAGDPVRLHAGPALAGDRRLPGRGGAGHARAGRVGPPRRQVAGRDRPRRAGPAGRRRRVGGHPVHRRHRPGRPGVRRRQGAGRRGGRRCRRARRSSLPGRQRSEHDDRPRRRPDGLPASPDGCTDSATRPDHDHRRVPSRSDLAVPRRHRSDGQRPTARRSPCPAGARQLVPGSSWGTFTIACTIPIALFVGLYMYRIRKGKVVEASLIGARWRAGGRRSPATGFPARRWSAFFSLTKGPDDRWPCAATASSPRCCRSGCCSARATTCRASSRSAPSPCWSSASSSPTRRCRARRSTTIFLDGGPTFAGRHLSRSSSSASCAGRSPASTPWSRRAPRRR